MFKNIKEKHKYSLRKYSIGVVSTLLSVSLCQLVSAPSAFAEEQHTVSYHYVLEDELSSQEQQLLQKFSDHQSAQEDTTYYFVYRPAHTTLPNTGINNDLLLRTMMGGLSLIILTVVVRKKAFVKGVVLISLLNGTFASQALAVNEMELAQYVHTVTLNEGEALPLPKEISGYEFTGYYLAQSINSSKVQPVIKTAKTSEELPLITEIPQEDVPTVEDLPEAKIDHQQRTEVQDIPYETQEVQDDALSEGERQVTQQGQDGSITTYFDDTYINGELAQSVKIKEDMTPATPQIIHVGTKLITEVPKENIPTTEDLPEAKIDHQQRTEVQAIPYETQEVQDDALSEGERQVVQQGKEGHITTTFDDIYVNGELVKSVKTKVDTVPATPQIVHVGTKLITEVPKEDIPTTEDLPEAKIEHQQRTGVQDVPYETQEVQDDALSEGERQVVQQGKEGRITTTFDDIYVNGELVKSVKTKVDTVPAIPQITHIGTKPITETKVTTELVEIPYKTEEQADPTLWEGERVVATPGQVGQKEVMTTQPLEKGQAVGTPIITEKVIKEVVNEIVRVGTKPITETKVTTELVEMPYKTEEQADTTLWEGERVVATPGQVGQKEVMTSQTLEKGQAVGTPIITEKVIKEVVNEIVRVGSKPIQGTVDEDNIITTPFDIQYVDDSNLMKGTEVIKVTGQEEQKRVITTYQTIRGVKTDVIMNQREEIIQPLIHQVIHRGTKTEEPTTQYAPLTIQLSQLPALTPKSVVTDVHDLLPNANYQWLKAPEVTPQIIAPQIVKVTILHADGTSETITRKLNLVDDIAPQSVDLQNLNLALKQPMTPVTLPMANDNIDHAIVATIEQLPKGLIYQNGILSGTPETVGTHKVLLSYRDQAGNESIQPLFIHVIDEASRQHPQSKTQQVKLNAQVNPQDSIDIESLNHVQTYRWKSGHIPSTQQVANDVAGIVEVVYTDGSIDEVPVNIQVVAQQAPTLEIVNVTKNDDEDRITVKHQVTDSDNIAQHLTVKVYQGDKLVKTVPFEKSQTTVNIDGLPYDVDYKIVSTLEYPQGQQTQTVADAYEQLVRLERKKIEFKHVTANEIYQVGDDGNLTRVLGLSEVPQDLSRYIVKIKSDTFKDILVPIKNITSKDNKWSVQVHIPQLVSYKTKDFVDDYQFDLDKVVLKAGAHTSFKSLVQAMKADPTGHYYLASHMLADEEASGDAYVPSFSGTLSSVDGQTNFDILGLKKPLFNQLTNATIDHINLKNVHLTGEQQQVGVLAKTATNSQINHVHVTGDLSVKTDAAGLVYQTSGGAISNSSFEGKITLPSSAKHITYTAAGLVGKMSGTTLSHSYAKAQIQSPSQNNSGQSMAGLVGTAVSSKINHVYSEGTITPENTTQGNTFAGIASQLMFSTLDNAVSAVKVPAGQITVTRSYGSVIKNLSVVDKEASGLQGTVAPQKITREAADQLIKEWQLKPQVEAAQSHQDVNYLTLPHAEANRTIAYYNTEKLLPFYDRQTIVNYGNKISNTSKLFNTKIVSVVPMSNQQIVTNLYDQQSNIDHILVYYADGTSEKLSVSHEGKFKDTSVVEYRLGTDLLYTPEQFISSHNQLATTFAQQLSSVTWRSEAIAQLLGLPKGQADDLKQLYLDRSFDEIKQQLSHHIQSVLSSALVTADTPAINQYLEKLLSTNKLELLVGMTYLNRLYGVHYQEVDTKPITMYRPDFFGNKVDVIDWLTSLSQLKFYKVDQGKQSFYDSELALYKNDKTFNQYLAPQLHGIKDLPDFLNKYRLALAPNQTPNDWFINASKAYIVESPSILQPNRKYRLYDKLLDYDKFKRYMLLMLTVPEDTIYVASDAANLTLGSYGTTIDVNLAQSNPELYRQEVTKAKGKVDYYAKKWRDYIDFLYRISSEEKRDYLFTAPIDIFDGYNIIDGKKENGQEHYRWAAQYDDYQAVEAFFGPAGKWYGKGPMAAYNIPGNTIRFVLEPLLADMGASTYSHELVHNYDEPVLFNGYGMRRGQGKESYAYGLFQSGTSVNDYYYGINTIVDLPHDAKRTMNYNVSRFQNTQDLQQYLHGVFDVTYTLDALEAQEILKLSANEQHYLFNQLIKKPVASVVENGITYEDANEQIVPITSEQWRKMNIQSINDMIKHNLVGKDGTMLVQEYNRNDATNYYIVPTTAINFSGLQNDKGTMGGLTFRRTIFELLAEYGWDKGFLSYATNRYQSEAQAQNKPLSDTYIFSKIFDGKYKDYAEFKSTMLTQHLNKADQMKPITITWKNKAVTITNKAQLEKLMSEAIQADLLRLKQSKPGFEKQTLKLEILKAYHLLTDDFKSSIYQ